MRSIASAALLTLLSLGCGDSTEPESPSGSVTFSFVGGAEGGGSFSAVGVPPASNSSAPPTTPFSAGVLGDAGTGTIVVGFQPHLGKSWFALIALDRATPGTSTLGDTCDGVTCTAFVDVEFGGDPFGDAQPDYSCVLTSGVVTLLTVTGTRTTGTFSGSGTCVTPAAETSSFSISNGTFSVPFVKTF